jgi:hypothetical protein
MKLPYSFRNVSRQLTEEEVHAFEAEFGASLPADYRSFLLSVNGGYPEKRAFYYDEDKSFVLQRLYPLTDELESYFNLPSTNHSGSEAPKGFLIIGGSSFGDSLCLGVRPPHVGRMIYIDHEERDPDEVEENEWLGVTVLAESFEGFMTSLV